MALSGILVNKKTILYYFIDTFVKDISKVVPTPSTDLTSIEAS
jgi:hypothetical protein